MDGGFEAALMFGYANQAFVCVIVQTAEIRDD